MFRSKKPFKTTVHGGHKLEISYVTSRIITAGSISDKNLEAYMAEKHQSKYIVYDVDSSGESKFKNAVLHPMDEKNAIPLYDLRRFCEGAEKFLLADIRNVLVVHCKDGLNPSGVAICCLLLKIGKCKTVGEAIKLFRVSCTTNNKAIELPCHQRYIEYFAKHLKKEFKGNLETTKKHLLKVHMHGIPNFDVGGGCDPYFHIQKIQNGKPQKIWSSKVQHKVIKYKKGLASAIILCDAVLEGDCKLVFRDQDTLNADDDMFSVWINPYFEGPKLHLQKWELDIEPSQQKNFPKNFSVELFLSCDSLSEVLSEQKSPNSRDTSYTSLSIRGLVSKKKVRYTEGKFDLDLTYITPRIIAMGFPATGTESVYRNPLSMVKTFFQEKHPGRYRIYNLCAEKKYDPAIFGGPQSATRYPFYDHNACRLKLIVDFCKDAETFLKPLSSRIIAIHCKAGKGRTGLFVSCYLVHCKKFPSAKDALAYFGMIRTMNNKGVTIPSQMRYVGYYEQYLDYIAEKKEGEFPFEAQAKVSSIDVRDLLVNKKPVKLEFRIYDADHKEIYDSAIGSKLKVETRSMCTFTVNQILKGDVKFEFYHEEGKVFWCWLNMFLAPRKSKEITFNISELDGACKKKSIGQSLTCTFTFA
mmetsp:Transcript_19694/g.29411  ORF Transcript_19694/g.29411 Transcript_19694/m.29411 type:complete len:639 (-) Transcript_19694:201-2117(-)